MFMCAKLNSLFNSEMNVYYVTQVLKQGININKELIDDLIAFMRYERDW